LDALEEGFETDEEGDSPLADESRDAVRVMTIHKAKGLEAPVVILADTAGGQPNQGPRRFLARMSRLAEGEFVTLAGPGFRNAASIAASIDDTRHEEAEDVRLLYVALTRARDRLIVFGGGRRKSSWGDAVASWSVGVTRRTPSSQGSGSPVEAPASLGAPDALVRFEAAMETLRVAAALPPFRSPSDLGDRHAATEPAIEGGVDALLARDAGRIVHARLAGLTAKEAGAALGEADEILRVFNASSLAGRLAQLDVLGREIPMLLVKDGERWRGAIDLLYRDLDGTLVVADFKTDSSESGAVLRHREQLTIYADAIRAAMPTAKVRAELWMLRTGHVLPV
jgi:ATP-dependent helicase/nuclease subunit A